MAKGDWPKSYIIPSIVLSGTAAGFLIWHVLDPAKKVDGWAITLLVVGFLPWLRTVFESITFPGGASVKWLRQVEAEQERQAADIRALQFLTANFLPGPERELLQRLASGVSLPLKGDGAWRDLPKRTHPLLDKGLIASKPPIGPDAAFTTVEDAYGITASGRQYLDLIAKLPADNE
jgi:hypothetical protein